MSLFSWDFLRQNQETSQASERTSQGKNVPFEKLPESVQNQRVAEAIRNLVPGQTISGEIVSIQGKEVQVSIDQNVVLNARLEQTMNLAIGQILNFEVKNNSKEQLSIRPLYANLAEDVTLVKALDEANLPPTQKNLEMASSLMEEGLPIDKKALRDMQKIILSNPQVAPSFLAQMSRLQIPFTQENMQQFTAYKNYEHQMLTGIQTIVDEIPATIEALFGKEMGKEELAATMKGILEIFLKSQPEALTKQANTLVVPEGILSDSNTAQPQEKQTFAKDVITTETIQNPEVPKEELQQKTIPAVAIETKDAGQDSNRVEQTTKEQDKITWKQELTTLADLLQKAGADPETVKLVKHGIMSPKEILQMAQSLLDKEALPVEIAKELFTSKEFSKLLKQEVMKQWTLEPQDVAKGKPVEELYGRMREQVERLLNSVGEHLKGDSALVKSAVSLKENIDFINQLNQLVTYTQLPLKLSNQKAHGDLYVYTNKQNLAKKDGSVSALLHLDMEHLGPVDIYVAMQKDQVSTKFYLQKEELLEFIESHLSILNERLEKRGYHMKAEVLQRETTTNMMEEILEKEKNHMLVSQYAFDVRA